ncbi:helix-turn-helix domain-containing protein [Ornithinimicrobium faecis]|uniref:Helix-turn-helix domain-containing protein n=1 Tax=Ornithinimicrobium faecis TaxID=2934158 RepID=A0ABY4YVE5_9MICO|nr:helix-turn-helix domain-containing protein [Ornithinimicrobium sp. HY1793]USQ80343.1 helix-turn-helix domain-containing protein [Ornithinimicrobium sp. HY1793]
MVAPALRPYVDSLSAYDVTTPSPGTHRGLPSSTLTLVLPLQEPVDVSWADDPASRRTEWSIISGLHTAPAHIHHGRRQVGIQLQLTVLGTRALTGLPIGALAGQLCHLEELSGDLPPALRHLPEELSAVASAADGARLVSRRLMEALAATGAPGPRAEVGHALARLSGGSAVATVARETGFSRRHLGTLVRAECGVTPKQFQRLARFQTSLRHWQRAIVTRSETLADVAATSGYADQAHLTREWSALAGCTPTQWAREEFPFVQDPQVLTQSR